MDGPAPTNTDNGKTGVATSHRPGAATFNRYSRTVFLWGGYLAIAWGIFSIWMGSKNNNNGEFYDSETGEWDLIYCLYWLLLPLLLWALLFAVIYGIVLGIRKLMALL